MIYYSLCITGLILKQHLAINQSRKFLSLKQNLFFSIDAEVLIELSNRKKSLCANCHFHKLFFRCKLADNFWINIQNSIRKLKVIPLNETLWQFWLVKLNWIEKFWKFVAFPEDEFLCSSYLDHEAVLSSRSHVMSLFE